MQIELPFPASSLAGHAEGGGQWKKIADTKKHREWARLATLEANISVPEGKDDIRIHFRFEPPNRRGDRVNFPNRLKPYIDGIADALRVNDSRFLPSYEFGDPVANGRVIVTVCP
jgi:hypothetical protein